MQVYLSKHIILQGVGKYRFYKGSKISEGVKQLPITEPSSVYFLPAANN